MSVYKKEFYFLFFLEFQLMTSAFNDNYLSSD